MRKLVMMAGLAIAAMAPAAVVRADEPGEIACELDLQQVSREVNAEQSRLPPDVQQQLRERLDVAATRCEEGLNAGSTDLVTIRSILAKYGADQSSASR